MSVNPCDIQPPSNRRLFYIGATAAACLLAWLAALAVAPTSAAEDIPFELFMVLLAAAGVLTVVSVILVVAYANLKTSANNQRCIVMAIGALAAEQEQGSAKLDQLGTKLARIDPWTIYTAVYEDLLKDRN